MQVLFKLIILRTTTPPPTLKKSLKNPLYSYQKYLYLFFFGFFLSYFHFRIFDDNEIHIY